MVGPTAFPQWRGFEKSPEGRLLEQVVDISGAVGIAYERSVGFRKDFHVHDRDMLVCPRGASAMTVSTLRPAETFRVDSSVVLVVPRGIEHDDEGLTTVYDTVALYPDDAILAAAAARTGAQPLRGRGKPYGVPRTRWFAELLDHYFAARVLGHHGGADRLAFLERELVDEALRAQQPAQRATERTLGDDDLVTRTLRHIEANLFDKLSLGTLARRAGASPASLLRHFRRQLGETPYAYIRSRRLDEAMGLLKAGRMQVQEVALLVGYEDHPSFSKAFRARFGAPPGSFRP